MKNVSNAYRQSMRQPFRSQSEVKIQINGSSGIKIFNTSDIKTLNINNEVDPLSRKLPTEFITFSIIDVEGKYNPYSPNTEWEDADKNAEFTVQFGYHVNGSIEWLASDKYVLSGRPTFDNGIATFTGNKKLYTLTGRFYKGTFPQGTVSYSLLAQTVLNDAGLSSSEYYLDPILQSYSTSAAIPVDSHRNCLQLIAHACRCALYTDSNGIITIKEINFIVPNPWDFTITRRDVVRSQENLTKIDPLYKAESYEYSYETEESTRELAKQTNIDATNEYHIEFDMAKNVSVYLDGSVMQSSQVAIYASAADLIISGSGKHSVTVQGKAVSINKIINSAFYTDDTTGGVDVQDNPLITDYSNSLILRENTASWLQRRTKSNFTYRGNPELQVLDCIKYENPFGETSDVIVLKHSLLFDGTLKGELIVKDITKEPFLNPPSISFTSSTSTLKYPSGTEIEWEAVPDASGYRVYVDGNYVFRNNESQCIYSLASYTDVPGTYDVYVIAYNDDITSQPSNTVAFKVSLDAPELILLSGLGCKIEFSAGKNPYGVTKYIFYDVSGIDAVEIPSMYCLIVYNDETEFYTATIMDAGLHTGENYISAKATSDDPNYPESPFSLPPIIYTK